MVIRMYPKPTKSQTESSVYIGFKLETAKLSIAAHLYF